MGKKTLHICTALLLVLGLMISSLPVLADESKWEKSTFSSWSDYNIYSGKNELTNISTKLDKAKKKQFHLLKKLSNISKIMQQLNNLVLQSHSC